MEKTANIYLTIDISEVQITEDHKLVKIPQLDFAHQILYSLNKTSLWQYGKIHAYLEASRIMIEISPALSIPSSLKEFRHLIKDVMTGQEVKAGNLNLLKIRTDSPVFPKTRYMVDPYADKVIEPILLKDESFLLCLSLKTSAGRNEHVCFSKYPLAPLNQCLNIVSALERKANIF